MICSARGNIGYELGGGKSENAVVVLLVFVRIPDQMPLEGLVGFH